MLRRSATYVFGLLTGLLAAGLLYLMVSKPRGQPIQLAPVPTPMPVRVHVSGAVLHPGVFELPPGSIVKQAIEAAGGPSLQASLERLNQAAMVPEGQLITIPTLVPTPGGTPLPASAPAGDPSLVNINLADAPELDRLPGIGPALAQEIVRYREANGPFNVVDDLMNVPGIGPAKLAQVRDLVTVQ
jgi:competence protein ComEA